MRSETSTLACFGYNNNHEDFFQHKPSILDDLNSFFLTSLKSIPRLCISQLTLKISGNPGPTSSRQLPSHRPLHFNTKHKDIVSLSIIKTLHNSLSLLYSLSQTTPIRAVRITDLLTPAFQTSSHHQYWTPSTTSNFNLTNDTQNVYHENLRNPRPRRHGPAPSPRKLHVPSPSRRHASPARMAPQRRTCRAPSSPVGRNISFRDHANSQSCKSCRSCNYQ